MHCDRDVSSPERTRAFNKIVPIFAPSVQPAPQLFSAGSAAWLGVAYNTCP